MLENGSKELLDNGRNVQLMGREHSRFRRTEHYVVKINQRRR